jgi:V/A-type H+-transporting ATPase subunit I
MPESMKKLTVVTTRGFEEKVLELLGTNGVLHLKKVEGPEFFGLKSEEIKDRKEFDKLYDKFDLLRKRLGVTEIPRTENIEISETELKSSIDNYERLLDQILSKLNRAEKTLSQLQERKVRLELLKDNKIEVGELGSFNNEFVRVGLISKELTPRLDKYFSSLKYLDYKITSISSIDNFISVRGIKDVEEWAFNILSLFNFREFTFPQEIPKENNKALIEVDEELETNKSEINILGAEKNKLKDEFIEKLSAVGLRLRNHILLSKARSFILRSKNFSVLQGWIPKSEVDTVKKLFEEDNADIKNNVAFSIDEPNSDEDPPTLIVTPKAIKPFSILTSMLGTPNYREINPTVVLTILWIVMFGFMFPDLGQGILICALGAILAFVVKKDFFGLNLITIGKLLIGLGFSAAFFGALFGEFFLLENVIPALWLRPLESENVWFLLKVAIFFGIGQIFVGLTFGIINEFRKKDFIEAILGEHSVASITLFSGLLLLIVRFWTIRNLSFLFHWTTLIPVVGLTAILMKSTIKRMVEKEKDGGILEDFGTAIEMFISLLSNTVSYARLAGFLLAHVALAAVIEVLMTKSVTLGLAGLVSLNFLALTIELLVVMIQALRLLYYEFSTKFYNGTGINYNPLTLEEITFKSNNNETDKNL